MPRKSYLQLILNMNQKLKMRQRSAFNARKFDHGPTGFPLDGRHQGKDCAGCHKRKKTFRGLKSECGACPTKIRFWKAGAETKTRSIVGVACSTLTLLGRTNTLLPLKEAIGNSVLIHNWQPHMPLAAPEENSGALK